MLTGIFVDSREPKWTQELSFDGTPKVVCLLDCGDVWASCDDGNLLVIERKTPSDLLNSIKDKRIFSQAAAMRQKTPYAYVVVTGTLQNGSDGKIWVDGRATGWNWNSVQGALITIQECGVQVVYCLGDGEFEDTVLRLTRRKRDGEYVLSPVSLPRVMTPAEQMLTALPGIGMERAQTLIDEIEKPAQALAFLTWNNEYTFGGETFNVAGIGNGTVARIRGALGLSEGEYLEVVKEVNE